MQGFKLFLPILFVLFGLSLFAQDEHIPDSRLLEKYQEQDLQNIQINNPHKIDYLNYSLYNGYLIIDIDSEKSEALPYLYYFDKENKTQGGLVEVIDVNDINIYEYDFRREYKTSVTYRIGDTGKAIVFVSKKKLIHAFNQNNDE